MKTWKWHDLQNPLIFQQVKELVMHGAVFAYPTDTLYGLGGNFLCAAVHSRIDKLKGRQDLPYSVAVSSGKMLRRLTADNLPASFVRFENILFPGPYTVLLPKSKKVPGELLKGHEKIGFRIPDLSPLISLIEMLDSPLISTSVNLSGMQSLNSPAAIRKQFPRLDFIIDSGNLPPSPGSTVLDMCQEPPVCLRKGAGYQKLISEHVVSPDNDL